MWRAVDVAVSNNEKGSLFASAVFFVVYEVGWGRVEGVVVVTGSAKE